jgi:hypothetical protein
MVMHSHIAAYLHETKALDKLLGPMEAQRYMFGFQRYRRYSRSYEHNSDHITEHDILFQDHLEEVPFFRPVCLAPESGSGSNALPFIKVESESTPNGSPHQAIWMMTRAQVWHLEEKCNFFNQSIKGTTNHM